MKELINKLLKYIEFKKEANQDYYIIEFNNLPLLIHRRDLTSAISRTYAFSRDKRYIVDTPVELHSVELLRAEAKLSVQEKTITGE